jgi:hypothetical protein
VEEGEETGGERDERMMAERRVTRGPMARRIQNDANIGLKAHPEYEITMNKL